VTGDRRGRASSWFRGTVIVGRKTSARSCRARLGFRPRYGWRALPHDHGLRPLARADIMPHGPNTLASARDRRRADFGLPHASIGDLQIGTAARSIVHRGAIPPAAPDSAPANAAHESGIARAQYSVNTNAAANRVLYKPNSYCAECIPCHERTSFAVRGPALSAMVSPSRWLRGLTPAHLGVTLAAGARC
jgi:hypothetical protein